jgi:hypothetical protein
MASVMQQLFGTIVQNEKVQIAHDESYARERKRVRLRVNLFKKFEEESYIKIHEIITYVT